MRTLLLSLLLLASHALAQGMPGPVASAAWRPSRASGCVASWDASSAAKAAGHVLVGGVDLVPADNDNFARDSGAIPGVSAGAPTYPLTFVGWIKSDLTSGNGVLTQVDDGSSTNRLLVLRSATSLVVRSADSGGNGDATATGVFTAGRWTCVVCVWVSSSARFVYADTNTSGGTDTTSKTPTGLSALRVGADSATSNDWDGELGPMWLFNADLSGSAYSSVRTAIFNGADPERASGFAAIEHWPMEVATGASRSGSYDLTPANSPTATSRCLVVRDVKANTYHLRATTSAPDYDSTLFSNRGGVALTRASSEFMVCDSTPVTAAPLQVYMAANPDSAAVSGVAFSLSDSGATNNSFYLNFAGAVGGDPLNFTAINGGTTGTASSSSGYSAGTAYLAYGLAASTSSRTVLLNGGSEVTETTSVTPSSVDRVGIGIHLDSTPDTPFGGSIGHVGLLNVSSVEERANFHRFYRRYVSTLP